MENSVNLSNCASYNLVRARSRRKKISNLSSRLQPDFDVKNHLNHIPSPRDQLSDEDFIKAVKLLKEDSVTDALRKTLNFLQGTSKQLSFLNISDNYERFLLHIVTDSRYLLHFSLFNNESRGLARQIVDVVDINKSVFKWTYSYEDGLVPEDILVFKKVYFRDDPKTVDNMKGSTLSSSLEDLNITNKDISSVFKTKTLNTTIKFIKNDNQLTVEYAELLRHQAEFVNSLFCQRSNGDVGLGFKSLYSPLLEAVKEYRKVFDFQVSMRETRNGVLVTVRKIPKNENKAHTEQSLRPPLKPHNKSAIHNSSLISDSSNESESLRHLTKQQREFIKKQRLIQSLPNNYVKSCLQSIVNFMNDPLRASLEFNDIGSKESRFLQSITTLAKKSENHQHFRQDCVPFLKSIAQYKKHDWILNMVVGKVNKTTGLRAMSFQKVPACENGVDTHQTNKPSQLAEKNRSPKKPKQQEVTKNKSAPEKRLEDRNMPKQSLRSQVSTPRAISRDRRNRPVMGISFQTAGNTEYMDEDKEQDITIKCARKSKLYQDMSTPLESDKAERMMVMMGWKGGALGARGEGITEPIIPPLHLSKGAGLGHIRPITRTATEFRRTFLDQVMSFVSSSESETALTYNPLLTKQERKFVNDCLSNFNDRKLLGVCFRDEMQMARKIIDVLKSNQCLQLQCNVSEDKSSLKLNKTKTSKTRKSKAKKKTSQNINSTKSDISIRIDELIEMFASQHNCSSAKSVKSLAYRIIFLENIKEFLEIPDVEKEYVLDCIINTKQRAFVQMVVTNLNRREIKVSFSSVTEIDMYREIRRAAEDCYITVTFDSNKLIMQKRYYQKRFTNSALLPPPVSTDLKNTIIYKNNVAITINQNDTGREVTVENEKVTTTENEQFTIAEKANDESDDDDVILIEGKKEIIVISDSESPEQSMETEVTSKECDQSKYSIESNITNESLLLQMLEEDNDLNSADSKLEKDDDIKELVAAMEKADQLDIKTEKNDDLNVKIDVNENDVDLDNCVFKIEEEIIKLEHGGSEVNNNVNLVRNKNVADVENEPIQNLSQSSSKRSRSLSDDTEPFFKISKCNKIKKVCITPKNHPKENITRETVQKFQLMISDFLDKTNILPLIECHGVQDGGLIYSCHNEKTFLWLENFISVANLGLKIYDVDHEFCLGNHFVVKFKINTFIREDVGTLIDRMELYNTGLDTGDWKVLKEDILEDSVVITVEIDNNSLKFISDNNFCLFVGVDRARFSVLFD